MITIIFTKDQNLMMSSTRISHRAIVHHRTLNIGSTRSKSLNLRGCMISAVKKVILSRKLLNLILIWWILVKSRKRKSQFQSSMKHPARKSLKLLTNKVIHVMKILLIIKISQLDRLVQGPRMAILEQKVMIPIFKIIIS